MKVDEKVLSIDFINNDSKWPLWPLLPVERYKDNNKEVGIIIAYDKYKTTVFLVNLFSLSDLNIVSLKQLVETDSIQRIHYSTLEDLIDDGWEVD